jgi:hypothetical protein
MLTQQDKKIEYSLTVRQEYFKENEPNYEAIIYNGTPMDLMAKGVDKIKLVTFVSYCIARCVNNFNVSKNMNQDQISSLAIDWIESYSVKGSLDFPTIRIEEIITFLELAKTGKYGQPFDRIDASILQGWFEIYYKDRNQKHWDLIEQNRHKPEPRTINENDRLNRAVLTLAGKMGSARNTNG